MSPRGCPGAVEPVQLTGQMVITAGAEFSEELRNASNPVFKSLAFDVQQLVRLSCESSI